MSSSQENGIKRIYKQTTLPNGLRVVSEANHGLETVTVMVNVGVGRRHESPDEKGISHFLEHMFFRGTSNRTGNNLDIDFARVGAESNASTSMDLTSYYATTLPKHMPRIVEILSDMIMNSVFPANLLRVEREVVREEILMYKDDPEQANADALDHILFPRHPLSEPILGSYKSLRSFTRRKLQEFAAKYYRPDNMVISAAGNVDHDALVAEVRKTFGSIPVSTVPLHDVVRQPPKLFNLHKYRGGDARKERALEQIKIRMGTVLNIQRNTHKYRTLELYVDILGGGANSRLFDKVRKVNGLAYGISAFSRAHTEMTVLLVESATSPKNAEKLLRIVCSEIAKAAKSGITAEELEIAKIRLDSAFRIASDDTAFVAGDIGEQLLLSGSYSSLEDTMSNYLKVTQQDVNKIAAEIANSPLAMATLGKSKGAVPALTELQKKLVGSKSIVPISRPSETTRQKNVRGTGVKSLSGGPS